jgi:hypothetical protein
MKTLPELIDEVIALRRKAEETEARIAALEEANGLKNRGPKADRAMTEEDAFRIKFGDLNPKVKNHKEAAAELGLSYGQVFSARGGYTFKHVKATWTPKNGPKTEEEQ